MAAKRTVADKICPICGIKFKPETRKVICCCVECGREHHFQNRCEKTQEKLTSWVYVYCGKEYGLGKYFFDRSRKILWYVLRPKSQSRKP